MITFPSGEDRLAERGFYAISGLAWSGGGTVRRVEVSTDNGRTWKDAQLQEPVLKRAFTRFHLMWKWNGEETVIQSRCIDDLGQIQPSVAEFAKFWNKSISEIHRTSGSKFGHANFIQPWKVTADGSVQNALEA